MADTAAPVYKTFGFWAVVALTNVGLLLASGIVLPGVAAQVVGWVMTVLTSLGYKGWVKPADPAKTDGIGTVP